MPTNWDEDAEEVGSEHLSKTKHARQDSNLRPAD